MAETQEDKTADVKTLHKEPPFQAEKHQLLTAFGVVALLQPVSQDCLFPPSHKYWRQLLATCHILLAHPVSSQATHSQRGASVFLNTWMR